MRVIISIVALTLVVLIADAKPVVPGLSGLIGEELEEVFDGVDIPRLGISGKYFVYIMKLIAEC